MTTKQRVKLELFGPRTNEYIIPPLPGKRAGQDLAEAWMKQITKDAQPPQQQR